MVVGLSFFCGLSHSYRAAGAAGVAGHWEGSIAIPGSGLHIVVDLAHEGDQWNGRIDIPAQGAIDLPLTDIGVERHKVWFSIADIPGDPRFAGELLDGEIHGTFEQSGIKAAFFLGREPISPSRRPQEPEPPFPYAVRDVTYLSGEVTLAATLTLPEGGGPFPAVVLITGSGPQDRDEAVLGHKPFLVLADHLTRNGIAVLRADDRGVGGTSGSAAGATSADFADDVLAGVRFLSGEPEIDADRIGLIGHSEGGYVGTMAANRSASVKFVVLLAAPGVPGAELLVLQSERIARARGIREDRVAAQVELQRRAIQLIREEEDPERLRPALRGVAERQLELLPDDERRALGDLDATIDAQVARVSTPWFRYFLNHDPAEALRQLRVPVLVLCGELDLQVPPDRNLPAIREALAAAGNPDVEIHELGGLNHLFQTAETGLPTEYGRLQETLSPRVLELVSDWILARFGNG